MERWYIKQISDGAYYNSPGKGIARDKSKAFAWSRRQITDNLNGDHSVIEEPVITSIDHFSII